jgi:hypothetical protein
MRRIVLALAVGVALCCAPPQAAAAPKRGCGPKVGLTVWQSATIRVFFTEKGAARSYYACWRRGHGKTALLGSGAVGPAGAIGRFRLRGRYLAYVHTTCGGSSCHFVVDVLDVKRRTSLVSTDSVSGEVRTLLATRGGAAAFLAVTPDRRERFVQKLDRLGVEEIARGPGVRALTLHGGRLHWWNGMLERDDHIAHVRTCGPLRRAQTIGLNRHLRVYSKGPDEEGRYRSTYACLLGGGRPLFLGADDPPSTGYSYHDDFQLAGHHVFWVEYGCYATLGCDTTVHVADVVKRRRKRSGRLGSEPLQIYPNNRGFAAELYSPTDGFPDYRLYGFDSTGEHLLDSGPKIEPDSIRVFADAVVWRNDGVEHSAPLR